MAKTKDGFFKQTASSLGSDDYILLGGGGHTELNKLVVGTANNLKEQIIVSSKKFTTLTSASWTDTGYTFKDLTTGTYAIQLTSDNLVASGIMSVYINLTDTVGDEIPLHVYGTASWRPYLRTFANKLQISSNDTSATDRTVTIKIARIL